MKGNFKLRGGKDLQESGHSKQILKGHCVEDGLDLIYVALQDQQVKFIEWHDSTDGMV